jgi:hypothetical protein
MALLLLVQVPAVAGVTFAVDPIQTDVAPPKAGLPGIALTATLFEAADTHVLLFVTVKV